MNKQEIERKIKLIQELIERTNDSQTRSALFIQKIELLKLQSKQKPTIKEIFLQLKKDIGDD